MRRRTGLDELHCTVVVGRNRRFWPGLRSRLARIASGTVTFTVGIECRVELLGHAPRLRGHRVGSVRNQVRTSDP